MDLQAVPAFSDNYIWMISEPDSGNVWVVDPGEASPVLNALSEMQLTLAGILVTHHHGDHVGGIAELLKTHSVPVYGPEDSPAADSITDPLAEGDTIRLGNTEWLILTIPGHTLDHIAYYSRANKLLFCGDTLFSAGCGRVFEGTMEQMFASLQKLAALPDETRVCCAHEYTLSNLRFASAAEPDNTATHAYQLACIKKREAGLPTLPSNLGQEKQINPFLRVNNVSDFAERRRWKDNF